MKKYKRLVEPKIQPTYRDGRPVIFKIKAGVRKIILKRDGLSCQYCRERLTIDTYTIDHIFPASKGGTEHPTNLVICCAGCNRRAKDLVFVSFDEKKEYLLKLAKEARINKARKIRK